ncbi:MAG: hypothetical protein KC503_28915 [Myxococcales bacterium]|nr:hypothetical protein [Myxococcales bacterium]
MVAAAALLCVSSAYGSPWRPTPRLPLRDVALPARMHVIATVRRGRLHGVVFFFSACNRPTISAGVLTITFHRGWSRRICHGAYVSTVRSMRILDVGVKLPVVPLPALRLDYPPCLRQRPLRIEVRFATHFGPVLRASTTLPKPW